MDEWLFVKNQQVPHVQLRCVNIPPNKCPEICRFVFPGDWYLPTFDCFSYNTETQGHCIPNEGPQITLEPLAKASGHVFHETCVRLSTQKIKKEGGAGGINKEEELECCLQLHIEKDRKKDQLRLSQTKKKHQSAREKYRVESRGF